MLDMLTDLSDAALARAIKTNFYTFFGMLNQVPSVDFARTPTLTRWRTPIAHPFFQGVLVTAPAPGDEERLIVEARDFFAQQGAPGFCWWFSQDVDQAPWREPLDGLGFKPDNDPPGMALRLDELVAPAIPAGLTIERVTDPAAFQLWNSIFAPGYGLPPEMGEPFAEVLAGVGDAMRHYIGYLDGVPVATSSLYPAAGVAGIYDVATLPEARGKGIGAAVTAAPLLEARAEGYRAAILQSSDMGFSVYQRLGFRHLVPMDHYYWLSHPEENH